MSKLPEKKGLPISLLAACFNSTSATYKYYWFLSILQSVEAGETKIIKRTLFARMISNAWYTVNYFHVSFGKQDKLQRAIELIKEAESLTIDDNREKIFNTLLNTRQPESLSQLKYFNSQVPHWFLSPWYLQTDKAEIYRVSQKLDNNPLYALFDDQIEINPGWKDYLVKNVRVLKDFCYWNLAGFLQDKNPNIPDIPNKLIKPAFRNSLTKQRRQFWDIVISELGAVKCIYTGEQLSIGSYAVEHFIPYAFVSHDLMWNLIPADIAFNGSKSDKLPSLDKHFDSFFKLQKSALDIIKHKSPKNKFLEDYLSIFPDIDKSFTKEAFKDRIQPLLTIASNNGFEFLR